MIFISGTAAIKGHATIAPGDTAAQLDCTLENLALISRAAGLGNSLGAAGEFVRHFKIYLRHASDHAAAAARIQSTLLRPSDRITWLHADVCRAALNVEIEATLVRV
jgi:enamine deaminase RidA (YjgF/YER057c/UK114 family)